MSKIRGFEVVSAYINDEVKLPVRKTEKSAGYDFYCPVYAVCKPHQVTLVPTGVKAYMQSDEVLNLYIRSSVAVKQRLILVNSTGIIDADYYNNEENEGHILVALYNLTDETIQIKKGDRFAQGVFTKFLTVDADKATGKRKGGIGSTKKADVVE